jgi:hypothetical protein
MTEAPPIAPSAQPNPPSVASAIARGADGLLDVDRLRGEVLVLKGLPGELATFAAALFELECAKRGDPDARSNMLDTADRLLTFWRDKSGDLLAAAHPTLSQLWTDASALLISFEKKRMGRALTACFEARGDAALLERALQDLTPAGDRRVEFATCLYHLELARLFVDSSRVEFAKRIRLVREAYLDRSIADQLVGDDPGLKQLWDDLVPYLDEFFEDQEQKEEAAKKKAQAQAQAQEEEFARKTAELPAVSLEKAHELDREADGVPKRSEVSDAEIQALAEPLLSPAGPAAPTFDAMQPGEASEPPPHDEVEIIESRELTPPPGPPPETPPGALPATPPEPSLDDTLVPPAPPPLSDPAVPAVPAPPRPPTHDSDVEVLELDEVQEPPPPPKHKGPVGRELDVLVDYEPDAEAQAFWRHTEAALQLLPDPTNARLGSRVLSADGRAERKKLNGWLDGLTGRFQDLPEARAMQCLMRLYMAAQVKEKTLFGQPNPKRKEAFRAALGLLSGEAGAAGRAAVWFELDGTETLEHLHVGLELVADFLQFCARNKLDPLDGAAADQFLGL